MKGTIEYKWIHGRGSKDSVGLFLGKCRIASIGVTFGKWWWSTHERIGDGDTKEETMKALLEYFGITETEA